MTITEKVFQRQLDDYLNGSLSEHQKTIFENELARNPQWQQTVETARDLRRALTSHPHATPDENAVLRIHQGAMAAFHRQQRSKLRPGMLIAAWAALAIILVAGLYIWKRTPPAPTTQLADAAAKPTIQVVIPTDDPSIAIYWSYEAKP